MNDFKTSVKLNVLPLGSYDILIGMDWLEQHRVVLNCFDKTFTCVNTNEQPCCAPTQQPLKNIISSNKIVFCFDEMFEFHIAKLKN